MAHAFIVADGAGRGTGWRSRTMSQTIPPTSHSGDDPSSGITITGLPEGPRAALAVALLFLTLLLLLLIPVIVLLVLGSVAIALVCGIGIPLIVLALVLGVATSPFGLVGLLIWLLVRRRDSHRYAGSATMAA